MSLNKQLNDIKYATTCSKKFQKYIHLYINHKPSTINARIIKYFKIIEDVLPIVIDLNRTILGSAIRIKQPILRKAWMLAGENQLNDSSLPSNILQDNLYMLLDSELGEEVINKWEIKDRFKNGIAYIVDDIDNRGTTKGDNNISIAELNDLPQVMFEYLPKNQDNEFNIDFDNDESSQDNISIKKPKNNKNSGGNRYLCMFNRQICNNNNDTDSDNEADDNDNITTNKNTNILKEYEYNCTQHFFDVYTNYLQGTWFATKKAILQEKLELIQAKQDKKYAEQNNTDNIAEAASLILTPSNLITLLGLINLGVTDSLFFLDLKSSKFSFQPLNQTSVLSGAPIICVSLSIFFKISKS